MIDLLDYLKHYNPPDRVPQAFHWSWPHYSQYLPVTIVDRMKAWMAWWLFKGWITVSNHRNGRGFVIRTSRGYWYGR